MNRQIIQFNNSFLSYFICATKLSGKLMILSVLNLVSSASKKSLFLRVTNPITYRNFSLVARSNIGFSFVYQAYGKLGISPK